jgi:hypothetical protein
MSQLLDHPGCITSDWDNGSCRCFAGPKEREDWANSDTPCCVGSLLVVHHHLVTGHQRLTASREL